MHKDQNGFAHIFLFLFFLLVIIVVAFAGWRALSKDKDSESQSTSKSSSIFSPGIYFRNVNTKSPDGVLTKIDGSLSAQISMSPVGYDIRPDKVVYCADNTCTVASPDGSKKQITLAGLYGVARPSFSSDGNKIAVQASATAGPPFTDLNIYVADIATGKYERVGDLSWNEESPRFFHKSNKLAYSSFSPTDGVNIHIYDLDSKKKTAVFKNQGNLQIAISQDDTYILNPFKLQIYNAQSGATIADLKTKVVQALTAAGYGLDSVNNGAQGQGSFPLDGSFSPDGKHLVLEGAITKNGSTGSIIFQIDIKGNDFKVLEELMQTNSAFTNNNNFSQINPVWL